LATLIESTVDELLAEIGALRPGQDVAPTAAFDADGTLWAGDVGFLLFEWAVRHQALRPAAAGPLARALAGAGEASRDLHQDAWRLFELYREGRFGERDVCMMMAWCFAGWSAGDLHALARRVLEEAGYPGPVHEGVRSLVDGLRAQRLSIVVVSGSPCWVVVEACRYLGIEPPAIFAMTPCTTPEGRVGTDMVAPITYREGKVQAVRSACAGRRPLVAFGDSSGDLPMLEDAHRAVAVTARPAVLEAARIRPERWRILPIRRTESGQEVVPATIDRMVI
jgi:phosphatidylglycerophosphatase C